MDFEPLPEQPGAYRLLLRGKFVGYVWYTSKVWGEPYWFFGRELGVRLNEGSSSKELAGYRFDLLLNPQPKRPYSTITAP